ncbi:MAG: Holliday junction resolvase RuvX [Aphanocapsa feldmannii 288cV]|nr:MAG: Holliday junction resolvase RuvX [Aphanocapsa feldmannii 288cV]
MSARPCSALGLDVGRRRIGLAGCDPLGLTVTPLGAVARGLFQRDLSLLEPLIATRRVQVLVVGLPLRADGSEGSQCRHARRYGERLARQVSLPLVLVDERCSSWAAAQQPGLAGDRTGRLDSAAAALILAQWLSDGPDPVLVAAPTPSAAE